MKSKSKKKTEVAKVAKKRDVNAQENDMYPSENEMVEPGMEPGASQEEEQEQKPKLDRRDWPADFDQLYF